jgi:deoxycytidylate deaminase
MPASVSTIQGSQDVGDGSAQIPKVSDRRTDELVLAVVGPVGSGSSLVASLLAQVLQTDFSYRVSNHKLSDIILETGQLLGDDMPSVGQGADRVAALQSAGNLLRRKFGDDYLAAKCVEKIARWRGNEATGKSEAGMPVAQRRRHVHILDSIKHPAEARLLRDTYGDLFWMFGVFAPLDIRRVRLQHNKGIKQDELDRIIAHDYKESDTFGQRVRDTFFEADFFVRNDQSNDQRLRRDVSRYVEILFGLPAHTPTQDESAMYAAYSQAMGSACLSRQVGAAILSADGELIGLGRNDVPRFEGGLYGSEDDDNDHRCFKWGSKICHNDRQKDALYEDIRKQLEFAGLLASGASAAAVKEAIAQTEVRDLIEYSRAVHAEMEAIISVARGEKAGLAAATLYCTTYPCHSCARHIVAAGISSVVYVEPYPKSRAFQLHNDAISESEADIGKKLVFLQYNGVAPKHALRLFRNGRDRKDKAGKLVAIDRKTATPVVEISLDDYSTHERYVVADLAQKEHRAKEKQPNLI